MIFSKKFMNLSYVLHRSQSDFYVIITSHPFIMLTLCAALRRDPVFILADLSCLLFSLECRLDKLVSFITLSPAQRTKLPTRQPPETRLRVTFPSQVRPLAKLCFQT